ncbi:MFS transporter [Allostreptomyces psammosilenae]|uniref:MFS family permease n=1 Tax=Allostreptomyces psammosilenae TaxID=1892865 RepID=A0A852ZSK6_9ACTN|nr:MFS transporter [Allostreptomyces psammosilenae]NYI05319.1 MFS family permease [Allostreptomyces psammosilenae]
MPAASASGPSPTTPSDSATPLPTPSAPAPASPAPALAWGIWAIGALGYAVAVLHRSSLSVAGIAAAERFDIGASALTAFTVIQVLVYAALQIPVGILVDRFGPRRLLATGLVTMLAGQALFAFSADFPTAVSARVLIGAGDATMFVSVLRLVAAWFPSRQVPLVTQLTAIVGMLGAMAGATPLGFLLNRYGWTWAFATVAGTAALVLLPVALVLRNTPAPRPSRAERPSRADRRADRRAGRAGAPGVRAMLVDGWREPGTRLGLWTHFTTQFPGNVFQLLWGYPFLVQGQHLSPGTASGLVTLQIGVSVLVGPLLGRAISGRERVRLPLALTVIGATAAVWAVVLAWPGGRAPLWLLVVLVAVMGANGPASMLGLDFARTYNPGHRLGTVSGIVNVGGFTASMLLLLSIGWLLDAVSDGTGYDTGDFRIAMCAQFVLVLLGVTQMVRMHRKATRRTLPPSDSASASGPGSAPVCAPGRGSAAGVRWRVGSRPDARPDTPADAQADSRPPSRVSG